MTVCSSCTNTARMRVSKICPLSKLLNFVRGRHNFTVDLRQEQHFPGPEVCNRKVSFMNFLRNPITQSEFSDQKEIIHCPFPAFPVSFICWRMKVQKCTGYYD
jgi:hypothetical protein